MTLKAPPSEPSALPVFRWPTNRLDAFMALSPILPSSPLTLLSVVASPIGGSSGPLPVPSFAHRKNLDQSPKHHRARSVD